MSASCGGGGGGSSSDTSPSADASKEIPSNLAPTNYGGNSSERGPPGCVIAIGAADDKQIIAQAKEGFVPPHPWELIPEPVQSTTKSPVYDYGVKMKRALGEGKTMYHFACLANARCRARAAKGVYTAIGPKTHSNALNHVKGHGNLTYGAATPAVTDNIEIPTGIEGQAKRIQASFMYMSTPERAMGIHWVISNIVMEFLPLDFGEKERVRTAWLLSCLPSFPVLSLDRKVVKHMLVELYGATASTLKASLCKEASGRRLLHLNLDLWTCKYSSLKFIGVRVWMIQRDWKLRSYLLAVRQFNPSARLLKENRLSALLQLYLTEVLQEFDLDVKHLFSGTTDASSDVKRLCDVLLPSLWEWCVGHLLNCALVEAVGVTVDPSKSENRYARKVVMAVKTTVELVRNSPTAKEIFAEEQMATIGKVIKLINASPHRWSGFADVLRRVLHSRQALHDLSLAEANVDLLSDLYTEIEELYALVLPLSQVIVESLTTQTPTGMAGLLDLAKLRLTTLDTSMPLTILDPNEHIDKTGPALDGAQGNGASAGEGEGAVVPKAEQRPHGELTAMAQKTRCLLRDAVERRFFEPRYDPNSSSSSDYVFDQQMMCHPATAHLDYLDIVATDAAHAAFLKDLIREKFIALAVECAKQAMKDVAKRIPEGDPPAAKKSKTEEGGDSKNGESPPSLFAHAGTKRNVARANAFADLGLFKKPNAGVPTPPTAEEKAREELAEMIATPDVTLANIPLEDILIYWQKTGARRFPHLARAAQVLLGAPASAAVVERDFSAAGRLITVSRGSTDAVMLEMIMFLHGNVDLIPLTVPPIPASDIRGEIPERLATPSPELAGLDGMFAEEPEDRW